MTLISPPNPDLEAEGIDFSETLLEKISWSDKITSKKLNIQMSRINGQRLRW